MAETKTNSIRQDSRVSLSTKTHATVVIPCFNEGPGIESLANTLKELVDEHEERFAFEIILVDDGSKDDTRKLLADHFGDWDNCQLLQHERNTGLMAAIMTGTRAAETEIVCSMDSDCTYHPNELPNLIEGLTEGIAMVTGSPYHPDGQVENMVAWRLVLSRFASFLYRLMLSNKLYCYTSCFRAFRKSVVENIGLENTGFVGTAELVWRIEQQGEWGILEVPTTLHVRQIGQSKCRVARVTWRHLMLMAKIVLSKLKNSPPTPMARQSQHLNTQP